jgi:hypothetical protein
MSYKYINGYYEVTVPIHDGFKRFHSMNAQYAYTYDTEYDIAQWDFVSYNYPLMSVQHVIGGNWEVMIAYDALEQSRSTNRQISRFLREINCPFGIMRLQHAIKSGCAEMYHNDDVIVIRGEVASSFVNRY